MAELSGIEYALLSGIADSKIRSTNNQFPVPDGYAIYQELPQNKSGLDAVAYSNGTKIVIAFGSTENTLKDKITDCALGSGGWTLQLLQAAEFYMDIKSKNQSAEITFTGYSLGGGLATLLAVLFNEKAVVFNPSRSLNVLKISKKGLLFQY